MKGEDAQQALKCRNVALSEGIRDNGKNLAPVTPMRVCGGDKSRT